MRNPDGFVACMIEGGIQEIRAKEVQEFIEAGETPSNHILWLHSQQREAAYVELRKRQAIARIDEGDDTPQGTLDAVWSLITRGSGRTANKNNIEALATHYRGIYHQRLTDLIAEFRVKASPRAKDLFFGNNPEQEMKLIQAIYGELDGSAHPDLVGFATKWKETVEEIRQDYIAAGGTLSKNDEWLLPQSYDMGRFNRKFRGKEGKAKFKEYIRDKLDVSKMQAYQIVKGKKKFLNRPPNEMELEEILDEAFDTISSGGMTKGDPMKAHAGRGNSVGSRHNQERILYYKDAESWAEVHREFGNSNTLFDVMMGYVDRMATDVATLEILPPEAFETALAHAQKKSRGQWGGTWEDRLRWKYQNASGNLTTGQFATGAHAVQEIKNVTTFSKLHSATLSAIADTAFSAATARLHGMSTARVYARQLRLLFPADADRKTLMQIGLTADAWASTARAHARFADSQFVGASGKLAQSVMRASGLTAWTMAGRQAFGMELTMHIGRQMGKSWDELPKKLRTAFERYDINAAKWEKFRQKGVDENGLFDLKGKGDIDFHRMIMTETNFAVPTPDSNAMAYLNFGKGADSLGGQAARLGTNLKAFPISIMTSHWNRVMHDAFMSPMDKVRYGAYIVAHTTLMGMAAQYGIDIISGKEPMDLEDGDNLAYLLYRGALRGGAMGLVGDMFLTNPYGYGNQGWGDTIFQVPALSLANDISDLTGVKALSSDDYSFEKYRLDAVEAARRTAPSIWQLRWATNAVGNAIEESVAPREYRAKRLRQERREKKERGRGYWDN